MTSQPDHEAVARAIFGLAEASWKLAVSLRRLIKQEGIVVDILEKISEALEELSQQCDLIWNALNKDGGSSGERDDPVRAAILRCFATESSEAHNATQELERTCQDPRSSLQVGVENVANKNKAARLAQDVRRHSANLELVQVLWDVSQKDTKSSNRSSVSIRYAHVLEHNLRRLERLIRLTQNERQLQSLANELTRHLEIETVEPPRFSRTPSSSVNHARWINEIEALHNGNHSDSKHVVSTTPASSADSRISEGDSDDDLEVDLVKAALDTGNVASQKAQWEEADVFFREALSGLRSLTPGAQTFCDIFHLHYQLALCSYHSQDLVTAKAAFTALLKHEATTPAQSISRSNASHMLALIGLREGNIAEAQFYCDKALKGRRRHLGKSSEAAYESTVLMAHIHTLLSNSHQAQLYRSLVPHSQRELLTTQIQEALDTKIVFSETATISTMSLPSEFDRHTDRGSSVVQPQQDEVPEPIPIKHNLARMDTILHSTTVDLIKTTNLIQSPVEKECADVGFSTAPEVVSIASYNALDTPVKRRELLEKIGCKPNDGIEDAVCDNNHAKLLDLLEKQKGFWRSKIRKRGRPERVTALHFAALFGDITMARSLLAAKLHDVNVVPHGYSTRLTPLKFAIGARQTEMIEFLIANGARPVDPDSWSTLAGHVLNRSWLQKTILHTGIEKSSIPMQLVAVYKILLKHGWFVNKPIDTKSGTTVLHQVVVFESTFGLDFDSAVQEVVMPFLIGCGADLMQVDADGQSPQELAIKARRANNGGLLALSRGSHEPTVELSCGHGGYG